MKRLISHLFEILVLGGITFLFLEVPLYKIPYIQCVMMGIIFILIGIWGYLVFGKKVLNVRFKNGKKFFLILLLGILLFSLSAQAGQFCTWAEKYHQQSFDIKQNNKKEDEPCDENEWETVRETLEKLSEAPSVFVPSDKLSSEEMKVWRSFRKDSHWKEWVEEKYSKTEEYLKLKSTAEEMACAALFESLCSEYERRHPDTQEKTVTQIMQKNLRGNSINGKKSGCWPCKMAYIILVVVQKMSTDLEKNMCEAGLNILKIFMLLWILYAAFLAVIFPSKGATFLKDLLIRMLCVMISVMILSSADNLKSFYSSVLSPIISLGLGVSEGISYSIDESAFSFAEEVRAGTGVNSMEMDYCEISTESFETENNPFAQMLKSIFPDMGTFYPKLGSSSSGLITPELQANLLCMTEKLYRQTSPITAVGQSLISFSIGRGETILGVKIPILRMWFVGIVLVVVFCIFSFLVAFKIIDIFLRLGFVLVLMPLFVATWAFPKTRDFTSKGFKFLMGIITEFFGLTLALNFIMLTFESGIAESKSALITAMIAPYSEDYGKNLYNVVVSNGGFYFMFMLVALFFVGTQLLSICTKVIASFFGTEKAAGLGGDITGAIAMTAIQQSATKLWKPASNIGKNVKPYKVENGKNAAYLAGRALGRIKSGENPLKDLGESNSPAASKRYFGQKTGNAINRASQYVAAGIDKIGVGLGQGLSKTGVGAILGVPLTLASKTLSLGVRATGNIASMLVKTPGATAKAVKNIPQTFKNSPKFLKEVAKNGAKAVGNRVIAGPKKVYSEIKKGFSDGKK